MLIQGLPAHPLVPQKKKEWHWWITWCAKSYQNHDMTEMQQMRWSLGGQRRRRRRRLPPLLKCVCNHGGLTGASLSLSSGSSCSGDPLTRDQLINPIMWFQFSAGQVLLDNSCQSRAPHFSQLVTVIHACSWSSQMCWMCVIFSLSAAQCSEICVQVLLAVWRWQYMKLNWTLIDLSLFLYPLRPSGWGRGLTWVNSSASWAFKPLAWACRPSGAGLALHWATNWPRTCPVTSTCTLTGVSVQFREVTRTDGDSSDVSVGTYYHISGIMTYLKLLNTDANTHVQCQYQNNSSFFV